MRIVMGDVEYQITPEGTVTPDGPIAEWATAMLTSDEPVGPQVDEYAGVHGTPEDYPQSAVAVFRDIADWTQLAITSTVFDEQPVTAAIDKGGFDEFGNWHDPGSGEFAKRGMSTAKAAAIRLWRAMIDVAETRPDGAPVVVTRNYPGVPAGYRARARYAGPGHANIDVGDRTVRVPWSALRPAEHVAVSVQDSGEPSRARAKSMPNYDTSFLVRRLAETHAVIAQGGTPGTSRSKFEDDTIERANIVKELLVRGVTPNPAHLTDWQNDNIELLRERALADPTPHRRQPRKPPTTTPYASVEPEGKPVKLTPETPTTQDMAGPTISGKADWYTTTVDGQTVAPHTRTAIAPKWITVAQDQPGDVWSPVGFSTADTREEALAHAEADAPGAAAWNVGEATVSAVAPPATVRVTERPFMQKEPGGEDSGFVAYKTVAVNDNPAGVIRKVEDTGTWEAIDKHWNVIAEFDTVDEARDAIAEAYDAAPKRDTDGTVTDNAVETWRIGDIQAKAAKLNDKADKKGLSGRVVVTVGEPRLIPRYNEAGIEIGVIEVAPVTVSTTPVVLPGGWKYAGVIDFAATEGSDRGLLHSASGYQLPPEFAAHAPCDDCGRNIFRHKLIVAADTEGNLTRLGSTCVKDLFGYDPNKLLWWSNVLDDIGLDDEDRRDPSGSARPSWSKESFLTLAQLAAAKYGYVKTKDEYGVPNPDSNKVLVTRVFAQESKFDTDRLKEFREYVYETIDTPVWEAAKAKAAEIEAYINSDAFSGRTEFEQNTISAMSLTHVNGSTAGTLAFTPMLLIRRDEKAAERAAKKVVPNEWIGEVNGKQELTGTVRGVTHLNNEYGTVLLVIDTDQGVVKVFASGGSAFANAAEDAYEAKRPIRFGGTIKGHEFDRYVPDAKQTVMTRVTPITTFADRMREAKAKAVANMRNYDGRLAALSGGIARASGQDDDWEQSAMEAALFDVSEARGLEIQDAVKEFEKSLRPPSTGLYSEPLDAEARSQLREFIQQQLDTSEPAQVDWLTPELIDNADLPITGFEYGKRVKKVYTIEAGGNVRDESGKLLTDTTAAPILRAALIDANPTLAEQIPEDPTASMTRLEKLRATPTPDTDLSYQTVNATRSLTQRAYDKTASKARGGDPETLLAGLTGKEQAALFKVLKERLAATGNGTVRSSLYADPKGGGVFNANVHPAPGRELRDMFELRIEGVRPPVGSRLGYMQRSDTEVADQTVFTVVETGLAAPDGEVTTWGMILDEYNAYQVADEARREWDSQNRAIARYGSGYKLLDPENAPPKPVLRSITVLSRPDISTPWQDNGTETIEIADGPERGAPTTPYVLHGDGTVTTVDGEPVIDRPSKFYQQLFAQSMSNASRNLLDEHDAADTVWVREQVAAIKGKRSASDQLTPEMIEAAPLPMDFAYGPKGTLYHITSGGDVFNAKTGKQVASQTTADKILLAAITGPEAPVIQDMVARPVHGSKVIEGTLGQVDRAPFAGLSEAYNTDSGTVQTAAREAFGFTGNTDAATPDVRMLTDLHVATQRVLAANGIQPSDEVTLYRPLDINEFDEWVDAGHPNRMKTAPVASYVAQDNASMRTVTVRLPAANVVSLGTIGEPDEIVAFPPLTGVPIVRYNPKVDTPVVQDMVARSGERRVPGWYIRRAGGQPITVETTDGTQFTGLISQIHESEGKGKVLLVSESERRWFDVADVVVVGSEGGNPWDDGGTAVTIKNKTYWINPDGSVTREYTYNELAESTAKRVRNAALANAETLFDPKPAPAPKPVVTPAAPKQAVFTPGKAEGADDALAALRAATTDAVTNKVWTEGVTPPPRAQSLPGFAEVVALTDIPTTDWFLDNFTSIHPDVRNSRGFSPRESIEAWKAEVSVGVRRMFGGRSTPKRAPIPTPFYRLETSIDEDTRRGVEQTVSVWSTVPPSPDATPYVLSTDMIVGAVGNPDGTPAFVWTSTSSTKSQVGRLTPEPVGVEAASPEADRAAIAATLNTAGGGLVSGVVWDPDEATVDVLTATGGDGNDGKYATPADGNTRDTRPVRWVSVQTDGTVLTHTTPPDGAGVVFNIDDPALPEVVTAAATVKYGTQMREQLASARSGRQGSGQMGTPAGDYSIWLGRRSRTAQRSITPPVTVKANGNGSWSPAPDGDVTLNADEWGQVFIEPGDNSPVVWLPPDMNVTKLDLNVDYTVVDDPAVPFEARVAALADQRTTIRRMLPGVNPYHWFGGMSPDSDSVDQIADGTASPEVMDRVRRAELVEEFGSKVRDLLKTRMVEPSPDAAPVTRFVEPASDPYPTATTEETVMALLRHGGAAKIGSYGFDITEEGQPVMTRLAFRVAPEARVTGSPVKLMSVRTGTTKKGKHATFVFHEHDEYSGRGTAWRVVSYDNGTVELLRGNDRRPVARRTTPEDGGHTQLVHLAKRLAKSAPAPAPKPEPRSVDDVMNGMVAMPAFHEVMTGLGIDMGTDGALRVARSGMSNPLTTLDEADRKVATATKLGLLAFPKSWTTKLAQTRAVRLRMRKSMGNSRYAGSNGYPDPLGRSGNHPDADTIETVDPEVSDGWLSTWGHEFAHSMQRAIPGLHQAEQWYLATRLARTADPANRRPRLFGKRQRGQLSSDWQYQDEFADIYASRTYGGEFFEARTLEMATVAVQGLYEHDRTRGATREGFDSDPELQSWLIGLMAMYDPTGDVSEVPAGTGTVRTADIPVGRVFTTRTGAQIRKTASGFVDVATGLPVDRYGRPLEGS